MSNFLDDMLAEQNAGFGPSTEDMLAEQNSGWGDTVSSMMEEQNAGFDHPVSTAEVTDGNSFSSWFDSLGGLLSGVDKEDVVGLIQDGYTDATVVKSPTTGVVYEAGKPAPAVKTSVIDEAASQFGMSSTTMMIVGAGALLVLIMMMRR